MINKVWGNRETGVDVMQEQFDHDLKEFLVFKNGQLVGAITPDSEDQQIEIEMDLDIEVDVDGWEDGSGNTISTHHRKVTKANVVNVLTDLLYRDDILVSKWMMDGDKLQALADEYNDLPQAMDIYVSLIRFLDHEIELERINN